MATYIHQVAGWPGFFWDRAAVSDLLAGVSRREGHLVGRMEGMGFRLRKEAVLRTLTEDVLQSSAIEGEVLDANQVRSSIARRLGIDIGALTPADRHVEGVVEMLLDATQQHRQPLTKPRLLGWHAALFPTGFSGMHKIATGAWRTDDKGPMRVESGPIGRERVHYEAPPADEVEAQMEAFLDWFNRKPTLDPLLMAAIAHLWFLTIHPFDDGNGRIARAIADMVLARADESDQRFYSMSAQIKEDRKDYYVALERAQKGSLDITSWVLWFLGCLDRALLGAERTLAAVLRRAQFWESHASEQFSARQRQVLDALLDDFEGKLTSSRYSRIAKCSQDTASRDIADLAARGMLEKNGAGGRSTSYSLIEPSPGRGAPKKL